MDNRFFCNVYIIKASILGCFMLSILLLFGRCVSAELLDGISEPKNYVAPPGFSSKIMAHFIFPAMALDKNGLLYMAYTDTERDNRLSVAKLERGNWLPVGERGFSQGIAGFPSLAADTSGTLYVAYMDFEPGNDGKIKDKKISVMKFEKGVWVSVVSVFNATDVIPASLMLNNDGMPHMNFIDRDKDKDDFNSYRLSVMRFEKGVWIPIAPPIFFSGNDNFSSLALDAAGVPYVAYVDKGSGNKLSVKKFEKGAWVYVGMPGFSLGEAQFISLTLNADGMPYVAYTDRSSGDKISVMKLEGGTWVSVGKPGFSSRGAGFSSLILNTANVPHVAYMEFSEGNTHTFSVMKFEGQKWGAAKQP